MKTSPLLTPLLVAGAIAAGAAAVLVTPLAAYAQKTMTPAGSAPAVTAPSGGSPAGTPLTALSPTLPGAPEIAARAWILVDVSTHTVLFSHRADERFEPASLTKLMTAYLAFTALKEKRLALDTRPPVSTVAHKAIGSRMFVDPRFPANVDELLHGLIIQSGNDAAVVLAEAIGGSEGQFATMMNAEAKRLGMVNSNFTNASGLPDPNHYSTPRDLATLAMRLIEDHPDFYRLYSEKEYTFNKIRQPNRNRLLFTDPSVDGVKTGHTDAAGYCLISSARREQPGSGLSRRMLSVLLGAASENSRAIESQKLLNYGFQNFDAVQLYRKGAAAGQFQVWKGAVPEIKAGFVDDVLVTVPKTQVAAVKGEIERTEPLVAPISAGQKIGTLRVRLGSDVIAERPLVALESIQPAGWFGRAWDTIRLWIK